MKVENASLEKNISDSQHVFLWSEVTVNIPDISVVTSPPAEYKMNESE